MATGVAGVFERAAATYDQTGVELMGPVAELLLAQVVPRPGERVLDVGCGRGAVLLRAARLAGHADGVDVSPAMVAGAQEQARQLGLSVDVRVGDAEDLRPPQPAYDVVTSSLVLFFLTDPLAALRAWRLLLVDGGRLGVSTFGPVEDAWRPADDALMAHAPAGTRDARTTGRSGPFTSDEGVEQLLRDAGLRDVATAHAVVPVRFDDLDHWYRWSWSTAQRGVWESLAPDERERVRAEVEVHVRRSAEVHGRPGFDQQVRVTWGRR